MRPRENAIELMWNIMRERLMQRGVVGHAFCEDAERAIREALASITPDEAKGCYRKAGYGADFFALLEEMEREE
jgi:hypothetical protein